MTAPDGNVHAWLDPLYTPPSGVYSLRVLRTISVIWVNDERKMIAFRLGFSTSCAASVSRVSVLRDPALPPKSTSCASESTAAFWASVAGRQLYAIYCIHAAL